MISKPLLKWAGGKSSLCPILIEYSKKIKFRRYIEPFFGGGAVYFNIIKHYPDKRKTAVINDVNHNLIIDLYNLKGYNYLRDCFNGTGNTKFNVIQRSAALMIINKVCFNGLYRVNSKGKFNVPEGRYKTKTFITDEQITSVSKTLPYVSNICCDDYHNIDIKKKDFVYLDPPYVPLNKTSSFTNYSSIFDNEQQVRLASYMRKIDKKGAYVIASNSNTEIVRELYQGFKIIEMNVARSINSVTTKRKKIKELLIIGNNF
jgi:DNA adenine methylase